MALEEKIYANILVISVQQRLGGEVAGSVEPDVCNVRETRTAYT